MRKQAVTVRLLGVRIAPMSKTSASFQVQIDPSFAYPIYSNG